ncbi:unnamed protein product [Closterium sp. NIES-54]
MAAAKRVLRYLCSTSGMGLVLGGRSPVVLTGHADASWVDDLATQRLSQGHTFSLGSGSVSWRSTRSSSVLNSSCEAEIYAGAMAAQKLRWLTYLLTDLGEPPRSPPVLYVDNKAMLALCREHRTKHIALRYFLARELQQCGQLRLAYVASQANTADLFTEALQPCDHQRFCTMLGCTGVAHKGVGPVPGPPARADSPCCPHDPAVGHPAARAARLLPALLSAALLAGALLPTRRPAGSSITACTVLPAPPCWPTPFRPRAALLPAHRPAGSRTALPCPRAALLAAALPYVGRVPLFPSRAPPLPSLRASLVLERRPACVLPCWSHATLHCPLWLLSVFSPSVMRAIRSSLVLLVALLAHPSLRGIPPPPLPPPTLLLLLLTSLVLRMSGLLLLLVGSAATARARVARVVAVATGVVVVEAVETVEVAEVVPAVGVVGGVGASVAAVVAALGVGVAVVAAVGVVAAAVVADGVELFSGKVLVVARGSSSSVGARPLRPSSFTCGKFHTQHCCFSRLDDAWRAKFGDEAERLRWLELLRSGVDIFALDDDAILAAMYALSVSAEGDCYLCVPPDTGVEAAALGASDSSLPGTAPHEALHTFTLDSRASRYFFRESTTLTPLPVHAPPRLADPSGGLVLAHSSSVLPCPAVPSGSLSGLHLPSFSTNLVSTAALQDALVTTTTPRGQSVSICTCTQTGRHQATFTRRLGSSLFTLTTEPPQVAASGQVATSGPIGAPCLCRLLSHQTLLWHHRLGHPSLPRLRGMHSRLLVSSPPRSFPPLPPSPAPLCLPCVEGWQRAAPHSSSSPPTSAPLQTLHMDVWGPARFSGQDRKRYFLLVVDDYTRYTTVFPLRSKGEVPDVLIPWIRTVRLQLRERFGQDLPVLRLHSDIGGEFSSDLLQDFCRGEGILHSFTLLASLQQNGVAKHRIGLVMEVARTSMIHAAATHFVWPFAVRYVAHQLNLWPRVSLPETSPTLRWTGKVGDASMFHVCGSRVVVRNTSADKLSSRAIPCGPAPSGVSQVDPLPGTVPVEDAVDSGATRGTASGSATTGGAKPASAELGGAEPAGAEREGAEPRGPAGASPRVSHRREPHSPQQLREWIAQLTRVRSGAAGAGGSAAGGTGAGGAGANGPGGARTSGTGAAGAGDVGGAGAGDPGARGTGAGDLHAGGAGARGTGIGGAGASSPGGARVTAGARGTGGARAAGPGGARTRGTGAAGAGGDGGAGAGDPRAGGFRGGDPGFGGVGARGVGARDPGAGGDGAGGAGAGGASARGTGAGGTGAGGAGAGGARGGGPGAGGTVQQRPFFIPPQPSSLPPPNSILRQVLSLPSSSGLTPSLLCPLPHHSQPHLQPDSPLLAPSPYAEQTDSLIERREPESRPASPVRAVCTGRRVPRPRPPPVPDTHIIALRPSSVPLSVPLSSPPASSLPDVPDPESDLARAASPSVTRLLAIVVTDPSFESAAASALVVELVNLATACRLNYAASPLAESESDCPPSVEGRPGCTRHPTSLSYAEAITGPYSSRWLTVMDTEMASWKSTSTYVDAVPPLGANLVDGMWIFRVKRPPGSPLVFRARYVARGFSLRQGVDFFQTFSPTPKMTTLRVLLHVAAQHDYELHSIEFNTPFSQGSLHEEIWLCHPPGFTGSFLAGTQWSLRTTLVALGSAPSTADSSLFLHTDTSQPPFYVLVYVDDLVFATADTEALALVNSELQKRHTCTDLGELRSYLGLQITRDRARCTITLTQSHMVH